MGQWKITWRLLYSGVILGLYRSSSTTLDIEKTYITACALLKNSGILVEKGRAGFSALSAEREFCGRGLRSKDLGQGVLSLEFRP